MKHLFGFKIGALNFRKLLKYLGSLEKCALNPEIAQSIGWKQALDTRNSTYKIPFFNLKSFM